MSDNASAKLVYGVIVPEGAELPWDIDETIETYWAKNLNEEGPCPLMTHEYAGEKFATLIGVTTTTAYTANGLDIHQAVNPAALTANEGQDYLITSFCRFAGIPIEAGPGWFLLLSY